MKERNILSHFFKKKEKIESLNALTLRIITMRNTEEYEISVSGSTAEVSHYRIGFAEKENARTLMRRTVCGEEEIIELLNTCKLLSWDGFVGRHPHGVLDGTMFSLNATVNGDRTVYAHGSQNFPKHYRDLTEGLRLIFEKHGVDECREQE